MMVQQTQCLVIGYGNTLRSDDGAGQHIAETIATWNLDQVQVLSVHQLTPELAEPLATVHTAIFVDVYAANVSDTAVQVIELLPSRSPTVATLGHTADPRSLLVLTQQLYSTAPLSWWVLVPAINFEFGEALSPVAQQGIEAALEQIKQLIDQTSSYSCESLQR